MKFVSTRELRNRAGQVRELLRKEDLVLTANGKPIGILLGVKEDNFEEMLNVVRQAKALRALAEVRKEAAERGLNKMSLEEINAIVRDVRSKSK